MTDYGQLVDTIFESVKVYLDARLEKHAEDLRAIVPAKGDPGERGEAGERGEKGEPGEPGPGVDPAAVRAMLDELVRGAVADEARNLPTADTIADMVETAVKAIEVVVPDPIPGADGKDGRDGVDGSDGRDGRDGRDGVDGKDAADLVILDAIEPTRGYPRGTWARWRGGLVQATRTTTPMGDAEPTAVGWRVVVAGVAEVQVEHPDERTFAIGIKTTDGAVRHTFRLPVVLDRGVYDETRAYERGDSVSCDGSSWIAQAETTGERPGTSPAWRLSTKRGRDGKDGGRGDPPKPQQVKLR